MPKHLLLRLTISLVLFGSILSCNSKNSSQELPSDEHSIENEFARKEYLRTLYYAREGTNVDSIRFKNWEKSLVVKQQMRLKAANRLNEPERFANNAILGTWHERGPINEAGDMRVIDFDPATENFYAISTSGYSGTTGEVGHLWKGNLNGTNWTVLNDDINMETRAIEVVPHNGSVRIFGVWGTGINNKIVKYSDDEGQTWISGTGFNFYDVSGRGRRIIAMSDNQTIYYLTTTWQASPWGHVVQLYKSNDKGVSYTKIWSTNVGYDFSYKEVDLWKPSNSDDLYLVDNLQKKYFKITNTIGLALPTFATPIDFSSSSIPNGAIYLTGKYNNITGVTNLYMYHENSKNLYTANYATGFTYLQNSGADGIYGQGFLADPVNDNIYLGSFMLKTAANNGVSPFQDKYNEWWEYYKINKPGHKDSMHVDIMDIKHFKKSDGTPFLVALNHAGIHVSYDHFLTTRNLGLNNLNVVTLYDQSTSSDGYLYLGAQDKGSFRFSGNSMANFNPLSTSNFSTGDGMGGIFFNNEQSLFYLFPSRLVAYIDKNGPTTTTNNGGPQANAPGFNLPGTHKPYWETPMKGTPELGDAKCYIGGGNLNGGSGSHLIFVDFNIATNSFNNTQTSYNFRANSNSGTAVIQAIGVSFANYNRLYIGTGDGTFFSSNDRGINWTKHTTANLPNTFRPWDIITSTTNADKVFISGTGFSNPGVYQSSDGGSNFTPMNNGLPPATVFEMALAPNEQYLFAATSEGPYVYSFLDATWYSLIGANTPLAVDFSSVDIINNGTAFNSNPVVRFGTYGRGVWDFEITNILLPLKLLSFDAVKYNENTAKLYWITEAEYNIKNFQIEHSINGIDYKLLGTLPAENSNINKNNYSFIHNNVLKGVNYYRLKISENNGHVKYSEIRKVHFGIDKNRVTIYPNPANEYINISVNKSMLNQLATIMLIGMDGKIVHQQRTTSLGQTETIDVKGLPSGKYVVKLITNNEVVIKQIQIGK